MSAVMSVGMALNLMPNSTVIFESPLALEHLDLAVGERLKFAIRHIQNNPLQELPGETVIIKEEDDPDTGLNLFTPAKYEKLLDQSTALVLHRENFEDESFKTFSALDARLNELIGDLTIGDIMGDHPLGH